jgi:Zn-dependent protease
MQVDPFFGILVLIISVILHEVAHGYMANYLGDPTARLQGRLTLNPISHIDPLGSIFLPLLLVVTGSPITIGYAKPVPYNPYNLPGKYDEFFVAAAGPATNLGLALVFGLLLRFGAIAMGPALMSAFITIVFINLILGFFNLIPIPPLDGSKVLSGILPGRAGEMYAHFRANFERFGVLSGTLLLLLVVYIFYPYFDLLVRSVFALLTGIPL